MQKSFPLLVRLSRWIINYLHTQRLHRTSQFALKSVCFPATRDIFHTLKFLYTRPSGRMEWSRLHSIHWHLKAELLRLRTSLPSVSHEEKLSPPFFLLERPLFEENEILLLKPRRRICFLALMKMISFRFDFQLYQLRIFSTNVLFVEWVLNWLKLSTSFEFIKINNEFWID